jgi:hypothetical protein
VTSAAQEAPPLFTRGSVTPRLWVVPPRDSDEAGREAVRFYRTMTGRTVLPWQELAVIEIMAERRLPDGRWKWAATDVGLILARQNGKGEVLLIIELYWLFVLKARRIFHSAQLQRTATDAHKRMAAVIKDSPKLLAQLKGGLRGIRYGKGDERIIMADEREIIFFTRGDNAGRGLYGDLLVLDESYDLTDNELAALRPLIKTGRAPQVIYTSTPVDEESMPNGMLLAGVRKKAVELHAPLMAWLEWSVPGRARNPETGRHLHAVDERLDDPRMWAMANPSMGWEIEPGHVLLEEETILGDRNGMGVRKFMVEDLCVPDYWPDPDLQEQEEVPFDPAEFERRSKPGTLLLDPVALGIDRSPDGRTALVAAGWHEDGTWGTETIYHRPGTDWVVPVLIGGDGQPGLIDLFHPAVLVLDAAGPAGALVAKLLAAKLNPIVTGITEMGRACQALVDDFEEGRYVPPTGDIPLATAVEIARWRPLGDARAFKRKGFGDISPLVAAALAGFGLNLVVAFGKVRKTMQPQPLPPPPADGASWTGGTPSVDFATVQF